MTGETRDNPMYACGECDRIVWLMEAGASDRLKCCDRAMEKMSDQEKNTYLEDRNMLPPEFMKPGSP